MKNINETTDNRRWADSEIVKLTEQFKFIRENIEDIQRNMKCSNEKIHSVEICLQKMNNKVSKDECHIAMSTLKEHIDTLSKTVLKNSIIIGAGIAILAMVARALIMKVI